MNALVRRTLLVCLLVTAAATAVQAEDKTSFTRKEDVIYGRKFGMALTMDVFTPKAKPNGLAIIDVVSGAWYSDRGKLREHIMAQVYQILCSRGYVVFGVRPGSRSRTR